MAAILRAGVCAAASVAFALTATQARADEAFSDAFWQYRAVVGVDYSSGTYGASTPTDVTFTYASLRAAKGPWTLKVVVPWLWVSGPALLLDGPAAGSLATRNAHTVSGPGDVNVSATYSYDRFDPQGLFIDFTARLKIPTASFSKGLGTGQPDGALQLDVAQALGRFMPFITLGYKFIGQPTGFYLRDVIYGTAGLQYNFTQKIAAGALFDYRQSELATAADPRELTGYVNIKFTRVWSLNLYGVAGFSRNSPSAGGGAVVTYRW